MTASSALHRGGPMRAREGLALLMVAVNGAVFLRWQRGLYNHFDNGANLFFVGALVWAAMLLLLLGAVAWLMRDPGRRWLPVLSVAACALASHAVVPASLTGLAILHAWFTVHAFGRNGRPSQQVLLTLATVVLSTWASYQRQYGLLSQDAIEAALHTHASEAATYILQHLTLAHGAALSAWLATALSWRWLWSSAHLDIRPSVLVAVLAMPVLFGAGAAIGQQALNARQALKSIDTQVDAERVPAHVEVNRRSTQPIDVVLLIGESSSRWHWSLYGYPRRTTPQLDAMRGELVVFTDAISSHSHTVPAIRAMAYRQTEAQGSLDAVADVSLVAVLRKAGVQVRWESAQTRYGPYSGPVSALAVASGSPRFHESPTRWTHRRLSSEEHPDIRVTRAITAALAAEPGSAASRLLVGHFHVSHFPYCSSLPTGEQPAIAGVQLGSAYFGDAADRSGEVECYDQAIRLTDTMIADVIRASRARTRPTVVIFVPDHGESPDDGSAHQSDRHSSLHIEIPWVIGFNDAARAMLPEQYAALLGNAGRPTMNAWLFELVADLFGVEVKGLVARAEPISKASFEPPDRVAFEGPTPLFYDQRSGTDRKDAFGRTRVNLLATRRVDRRPGVIYAHRVDTLGKALEAKQVFDGIEVDLVALTGAPEWQVRHPPRPDTGLRLGELLTATRDRPKLQLWLDLKSSLIESSATALRAIDMEHHVRGRAVLELTAGADAGAARGLAEDGWTIAVPATLIAPACFESRPGAQCQAEAATGLAQAKALGATALSFEMRDAVRVRTHLPQVAKTLRLMAWDQGLRSDDHDFVERLARIPRVDGLVVRYRSKFDY